MQKEVRFQSILDNDFYKFTMQNAVVNLYPKAKAKYAFINRGNHSFPEGFAKKLTAEVKKLENLSLVMGEMEKDITEYEAFLTQVTAEKERIGRIN